MIENDKTVFEEDDITILESSLAEEKVSDKTGSVIENASIQT